MAITWGAIENRTIETGVDRGVLYTGTTSVPWDGLVSVIEKTEDGALNRNYFQGIVYNVDKDPGNFSASIEAFSYPPEFEPFQGMVELRKGMYADNQTSLATFDLSYRTLVADGIKGVDSGYKIHLVYNAIAIPTDLTRNTISDSVSPGNFTWDISTSVSRPAGIRPTSHYVINSSRLTQVQLSNVESLIYGPVGGTSPAKLPSVSTVSGLLSPL